MNQNKTRTRTLHPVTSEPLDKSMLHLHEKSTLSSRTKKKKSLNDQLKPYTMSALRVDTHQRASRNTLDLDKAVIADLDEHVDCPTLEMRASNIKDLRASDRSMNDFSEMFFWSIASLPKKAEDMSRNSDEKGVRIESGFDFSTVKHRSKTSSNSQHRHRRKEKIARMHKDST